MQRAIIGLAATFCIFAVPVSVAAQELLQDTQEFLLAEVVTVERQEMRLIPGTDTESVYQSLRVRVLEGEREGEEILVENDYLGLEAGDVFYLMRTVSGLDDSEYYSVSEPYRLPWLYALAGLFLLAVIVFGGWQGLRGLIALVGSLLVIFYVLLPGILHGYSPVVVAMGVASIIVVLGSYITHGFNKTTTAAVIGMLLTVCLTGLLSLFAVAVTQLSGLSSDESIYLNFNTRGAIDLSGLLLAGILIGLLGVLYDAAIGQAVAVEELRRAGLSRRAIFARALRIGREHIGALVNTLAIAYVGAALPLLLLVYFSDSGLMFILNREIFAAEIVRTLIGSIGIVLAVPLTTAIATLWLGKAHHETQTTVDKEMGTSSVTHHH